MNPIPSGEGGGGRGRGGGADISKQDHNYLKTVGSNRHLQALLQTAVYSLLRTSKIPATASSFSAMEVLMLLSMIWV